MTASLLCTDEQGNRHMYDLGSFHKSHLTIGRDARSDIQVKSAHVSRSHGVIDIINGSYYYCDLGSVNGTLFNGVRLQSISSTRALSEGDTLTLGGCSGNSSRATLTFTRARTTAPSPQAVLPIAPFMEAYSNHISSEEYAQWNSYFAHIIEQYIEFGEYRGREVQLNFPSSFAVDEKRLAISPFECYAYTGYDLGVEADPIGAAAAIMGGHSYLHRLCNWALNVKKKGTCSCRGKVAS